MLLEPIRSVLTVFALLFLFTSAAVAQETTLTGENEQRARALFKELRCVVCQNQSIDGSNADVARDLRAIVREQITAGKSDGDIRTFLVSRYGEFVLLKPAFAVHTLVLWLMPALLLLVGGFVVMRVRSGSAAAPLTADEQEQLSRIVGSDAAKPEK